MLAAVLTLVVSLATATSQSEDSSYIAGYVVGALLLPLMVGGVVALCSKPKRLSNAAVATFLVLQLLFLLGRLGSIGAAAG